MVRSQSFDLKYQKDYARPYNVNYYLFYPFLATLFLNHYASFPIIIRKLALFDVYSLNL